MKKINFLFSCFFIIFSFTASASGRNGTGIQLPMTHFKMPSGLEVSDYMKNTIVFKVKPEFRNFCHSGNLELPIVNNMLNALGFVSLQRMFPFALPPAFSGVYGVTFL